MMNKQCLNKKLLLASFFSLVSRCFSFITIWKENFNKFINKEKINLIKKSGLFDKVSYLKLYPDTKDFTGGGVAHYIIYGEKEGRKPNLFFDPKWYMSAYTLTSISSPLLHYIEYGELKGFQPSPSFDPSWYNKKYTLNEERPLKHFLQAGLLKQYLPNKNYLSETDQCDQGISSTMKIAVVIHVFYLDMVSAIISRITKVSLKYDLFFTVSPERKQALIKILDSLGVDDYELITHSCGGYDVVPFIQLLPHLQNNNYDLVCKLHTKKGDGELGQLWFKLLIDSIFGSEQTVKNIVSKFESEKTLGLVGGAEVYKSAQKLMYGNDPFIKNILSMMSCKNDLSADWGFFAGTMFWVRFGVLSPLIKNENLNNLISLESHPETTGKSASTFHALERVFGLLPQLTNFKTALSYPINLERTKHTIKITPINSNPASQKTISMTLKNELDILNQLKLTFKLKK